MLTQHGSNIGTWGDHVILHAASNGLDTPVSTISSLSHNVAIKHEQSWQQQPAGARHIRNHHLVSLQPNQVKTRPNTRLIKRERFGVHEEH